MRAYWRAVTLRVTPAGVASILRVYAYACVHARDRTNDNVTATQRCILLTQMITRDSLSAGSYTRIYGEERFGPPRFTMVCRASTLFNIPDIVLALHTTSKFAFLYLFAKYLANSCTLFPVYLRLIISTSYRTVYVNSSYGNYVDRNHLPISIILGCVVEIIILSNVVSNACCLLKSY